MATSCLLVSRAEAAQHRWSEHSYPENPNARDSDDWLCFQSTQCVGTRRSKGFATPSDAGVACAAPTRVQEALYLVHSRCCTPRAQIPEPRSDSMVHFTRPRATQCHRRREDIVLALTGECGSYCTPRTIWTFLHSRLKGTRHESLEACVRSTTSRKASG